MDTFQRSLDRLRANLSPEQDEEMLLNGHFTCRGQSGLEYRIGQSYVYRNHSHFCTIIGGGLLLWSDDLLARKLLLEGAEGHFLAIARATVYHMSNLHNLMILYGERDRAILSILTRMNLHD